MAALARCLALAAGAAFVAGSVQPAHEESIVADDSECDASAEHCGLNALQRRATRVGESRDDEPVAASAWGQCGGKLWKGTTSCVPGYLCRVKDEWYSQCVPGGGAAPASPSVQGMSSGAGDDGDSDEADGEDEEEDGEAPGEGQEDDEGQEDEGEEDESEEDDAAAGLTANPATPEPKRYESLSPIVVKGNYLYDSATGKRFFAKGTSYNPRMDTFNPNGRSKGKPCKPGNARTMGYTVDVIADDREQRWSEDLKAIANLGANTIRLFNVDPGQDHSKFMKAAESYGIYVIVPLNGKDYGFLPAFPSPSCYTMNMTWEVANGDGTTRPYGNVGVNVLTYGKQIVKQFSKFPNTLFFTVNNEFAMNDKNGFAGFQCVKALTRDIHRYQKSCGASMRRVPLIYSDYDMGPPDRGIVARYLTCALESEDDAIDVYGLNVYSYCEKAYPGDGKKDNFQYSPYIEIQKDFKDFSVPVLFTEFGCVEGDFLSFCPYKGGRTWPDVKYFFSKELGEILSGAIAYTYEQDYEERGMVLTPGFLNGQNKLHLLDNYYTLQKQFAKYHVSTKWDGAEITNCKWTPGDAAKQQYKHQQPTCPSSKMGREVQKRRRVEEVTDWHELPPSPSAPLSDVGGQSECPADEVPAPLEAEAKCHFDESSA